MDTNQTIKRIIDSSLEAAAQNMVPTAITGLCEAILLLQKESDSLKLEVYNLKNKIK